jgi:molecular chaperone HscB
VNYFEVFGLPRLLCIDPGALEKSFHELSRKYHPDYFTTASAEDRQRALKMTALVNDAYRTLRHPVRRVEHLLEIEGYKPDGARVPKSFLMEIFEINEQVEELKTGAATPAQAENLRRAIRQRAADFDEQIETASREWDRLAASGVSETGRKKHLERMTEILSESSYVRNLERELEEAL